MKRELKEDNTAEAEGGAGKIARPIPMKRELKAKLRSVARISVIRSQGPSR